MKLISVKSRKFKFSFAPPYEIVLLWEDHLKYICIQKVGVAQTIVIPVDLKKNIFEGHRGVIVLKSFYILRNSHDD